MFSALLLLATLLGCLTFWLWVNNKPKTFPPGPVSPPIVGHLPFLGKEPHKTLMKWSEIYGPVIGLSLGVFKVVIVHDVKLIRKVMNLNELSGRPKLLHEMLRGMMTCTGKQLTEQRSFFLKVLRDFGTGGKSLEAKMSDEISTLLNNFRATAGKPHDLQFAFNIALLNTLCSIMFSDKLDPDDPEVHEIIRKLSVGASNANIITGLTAFFPWLAHIVPEKITVKYLLTDFGYSVEKFIQGKLDKHQAGYVEDHPRDIADAYKDKERKTTDITSTFHPKHNFLLYTLAEMFVGGLDSVSKSLQWVIAYLVNYPEVQKKLQEEIDSVIGHDRLPSLADRPSMNYTEAVLREVLRHCSGATLSFPREAVEDVVFYDYVIPKGAIVMANYYSYNHDKAIWGDPENFRPEHFLDNNGKFVPNSNFFVFGTGKRSCLGESFARDQLFLVIMNLFQQFTIHAAGKNPTLEPISGIASFAQPFKVIFKERISEETTF